MSDRAPALSRGSAIRSIGNRGAAGRRSNRHCLRAGIGAGRRAEKRCGSDVDCVDTARHGAVGKAIFVGNRAERGRGADGQRAGVDRAGGFGWCATIRCVADRGSSCCRGDRDSLGARVRVGGWTEGRCSHLLQDDRVFVGEIAIRCGALGVGENVVVDDHLGDVAQEQITAVSPEQGIAAETDLIAVGLVERCPVESADPLGVALGAARRDVVEVDLVQGLGRRTDGVHRLAAPVVVDVYSAVGNREMGIVVRSHPPHPSPLRGLRIRSSQHHEHFPLSCRGPVHEVLQVQEAASAIEPHHWETVDLVGDELRLIRRVGLERVVVGGTALIGPA